MNNELVKLYPDECIFFIWLWQVVHDVDRQKIPVRFAIANAGLAGSDGAAYSGAFDVAFMSCLPNMIVMSPSDEVELSRMVATAANIDDRPVCFRYPRGLIENVGHSILSGEPIQVIFLCSRHFKTSPHADILSILIQVLVT